MSTRIRPSESRYRPQHAKENDSAHLRLVTRRSIAYYPPGAPLKDSRPPLKDLKNTRSAPQLRQAPPRHLAHTTSKIPTLSRGPEVSRTLPQRQDIKENAKTTIGRGSPTYRITGTSKPLPRRPIAVKSARAEGNSEGWILVGFPFDIPVVNIISPSSSDLQRSFALESSSSEEIIPEAETRRGRVTLSAVFEDFEDDNQDEYDTTANLFLASVKSRFIDFQETTSSLSTLGVEDPVLVNVRVLSPTICLATSKPLPGESKSGRLSRLSFRSLVGVIDEADNDLDVTMSSSRQSDSAMNSDSSRTTWDSIFDSDSDASDTNETFEERSTRWSDLSTVGHLPDGINTMSQQEQGVDSPGFRPQKASPLNRLKDTIRRSWNMSMELPLLPRHTHRSEGSIQSSDGVFPDTPNDVRTSHKTSERPSSDDPRRQSKGVYSSQDVLGSLTRLADAVKGLAIPSPKRPINRGGDDIKKCQMNANTMKRQAAAVKARRGTTKPAMEEPAVLDASINLFPQPSVQEDTRSGKSTPAGGVPSRIPMARTRFATAPRPSFQVMKTTFPNRRRPATLADRREGAQRVIHTFGKELSTSS